MSGEVVTEFGHAKLNLTLEVLGRRSDGYHNLCSLMTTVTLADTVTVEARDDLALAGDDAGIPVAENLAYRAACFLRDKAGVSSGALITLKKSIPLSAGLGGGSADAAATLRALNRLWKLGMSREELTQVGATIGSDVPFLVHEGAALVQGKGEDVTPVPLPKLDRILVLCPSINVRNKTATMFSHVGQSMYSRGALTHKLAARIRAGGDCPPAFFFNAFGQLSAEVFPGWSGYRDALGGLGATDITLTGAGPSMFAVPPSKELGTAWHLLLSRTRGWTAHLVEPFAPGEDGGA